MFCYQCEQTANGKGCEQIGICGKDPLTANLQDLLIFALKGLASYAVAARSLGISLREESIFTLEVLFTTVTNVNFDPERLEAMLYELYQKKENIRAKYESKCNELNKLPKEFLFLSCHFKPDGQINGLSEQGRAVSILQRVNAQGETITGLQEMLLYAVKGMASYAYHAYIDGCEDLKVYDYIFEALDFLNRINPRLEELLEHIDKCGAMNLKVMELLDKGNTSNFGNPEPTMVKWGYKKGKCILVSGHDLKDLLELLKATEGKGINIYTHGEMLPAHAYPVLKKYPHLVGHYGSAWHNQRSEFPKFPGSILMTTNCIQNPDGYKDKIFTSTLVAWPGVKHVNNYDFSDLIESAQSEEGFLHDDPNIKETLIGFAHNAVLGKAAEIVQAVKDGEIKRFFLIGGCDGHEANRNYYTEFTEKLPKDCVVLTLGCGKFKVNKVDLGILPNGIPRLLDLGQCNDAYSAIKIAAALSDAFGVGLNELPLSLVISWFEQKAVCILLTLLHLGIKNIYLGPNLPAFISTEVLELLQKQYSLKPIGDPAKDLEACLAR